MVIEGIAGNWDTLAAMTGIAWLPLALGGASFLKGLFGGNKQKQTGNYSSSGTSTTTPTLAPEYSPLQKTLLPMIQQRLMNPQGLAPGYEQSGIRNINKTYDLAEQGLNNNLSARGMSQSGMAGAAEGRLAGGRASDIVQYQSTLPILQRQMQNEDAGMAMQMLNMGRGQTTTGTQTGQSNSTYGGQGGLAGGASSLIDMLGFLYGSGQLGSIGGGGANKLKQGPTMTGSGGYY